MHSLSSIKSYIWEGMVSWTYSSFLIALIYTLILGYTSLINSLKDYLLLFLYIALFGVIIALILGTLCGMIIYAFHKISSKEFTKSKVSSLCYSILFSAILITLSYRIFAYNISFAAHPFIKSYKGMVIFIWLRMVALALISILAGYFLYRIFLWFKDSVFHYPRRIFIAKLAYIALLFIFMLIFSIYYVQYAKSLTELKAYDRIKLKPNFKKQVFLIGIDGASWNVIEPLLSQGALPNIKELLKHSSYAPLKTIQPCLSPMVWTSIDTGKIPEKHGMLDFYRFSIPGISMLINPYETFGADATGRLINKIGLPLRIVYNHYGYRRAKPVWQIISEQGLKVGVINWYFSWPPPKINGFILSDLFPYYVLQEPGGKDKLSRNLLIQGQNPAVPVVYPLSEIYQHIKEYLQENSPEKLSQSIIRMKKIGITDYLDFSSFPFFYALIEQYQPDFLAFYITEPDISQHLFWNYWEPQNFSEIPADEFKANKKIIPDIYIKLDETLGKLRRIAREDAVFIIVSDHGFGSYFNGPRPGGHADSPDGIIIVSGEGIKNQIALDNPNILDITPTILYLYNLPLAQDMDGRVLLELFDSDFIDTHPVSYINTYGGPGGEFGTIEGEVSKELMKKLKALGYIQ